MIVNDHFLEKETKTMIMKFKFNDFVCFFLKKNVTELYEIIKSFFCLFVYVPKNVVGQVFNLNFHFFP